MVKDASPAQIIIVVCNGNSCADKKSKKLRTRLKDYIKEHGLKDRIKVKKGDCMKACKEGPVARVGNEVLSNIKPKDAEWLVKKTAGIS